MDIPLPDGGHPRRAVDGVQLSRGGRFGETAVLQELVAHHVPVFEQEAQHPLVHAERGVHGRQAGVVEGAQARQGQLEVGPVLLQSHERLEVALQPAAGLRDLVLLRAEEEGVHVHGGGDDEHVANHDVETLAAGGLVAVVEEIAQAGRVDFARLGVLAGVGHGWMTVGGQELVEEQLVVVVVAQVQCGKCLPETS